MASDCEFCRSGDGVEAQDMGEGRMMQLCSGCRANIAAGDERAAEANRERAKAEAANEMSAKRLAEIRQRVGNDDTDAYWNGLSGAYEQASADRADLLAEVERLLVREFEASDGG
jgi:uncharacterized protein HemY